MASGMSCFLVDDNYWPFIVRSSLWIRKVCSNYHWYANFCLCKREQQWETWENLHSSKREKRFLIQGAPPETLTRQGNRMSGGFKDSFTKDDNKEDVLGLLKDMMFLVDD